MNCRPGDTAVIVAGLGPAAANIGRFVDVLQRVPDYSGRVVWLVRGKDGRPFMHCDGAPIASCCAFTDNGLRPIRGEPERESTTNREPVKETA